MGKIGVLKNDNYIGGGNAHHGNHINIFKTERRNQMTTFYYQLLSERNRLQNLIKEKESRLEKASFEEFKVSSSRNSVRYFCRKNKEEKWTYLKDSEKEHAALLAQNEYDRRVLPILKQKLALTQKMIQIQESLVEENLFWDLHPGRRDLIVPTTPVTERLLDNWNMLSYTGKPFSPADPEIYTEKGERVRSKSEKIIAEKLTAMGIPYKYEYPVRFRTYTGHVDFYVLNKYTGKVFYYEHFGMMEDDKYKKDAAQRIRDYEKLGIMPGTGLVMTFESDNCVISTTALDWLCRKYFLTGQPALPGEHIPDSNI